MPSSCKDIRAALAACLQQSDCVLVHRNKPRDCIREPLVNTLPKKCLQLKKGYGECRRGMLDMRKRFRGNYPVGFGADIEGGGRPTGGQLYAGRPAISKGIGETDGREDQRTKSEGEET